MVHHRYGFLEGRKFCVVLVQAKEGEQNPESAKLRCLRGRASVDANGGLTVFGDHGQFKVPTSAMKSINQSDGTELLKDAEYYCFVRVHSDISID
jgi:hypothetical protein